MDAPSLHAVLSIAAGIAFAGLVGLLALIARFYERLSGERTYYQLFAVPGLLMAGAAFRLAWTDRLVGDAWADALLAAAGASLAVLCLNVYRRMTSGR